MKSIGKCLSEKYVLNGIIESHFSDAYAYIFDYMFNFILYNLSLLTLGFLFHHPIAVTMYYYHYRIFMCIYGGYHCKHKNISILSYLYFSGNIFLRANTFLL
ncbi:MAG: accessory gene regulator B family protein [Agathobacter rectalis]